MLADLAVSDPAAFGALAEQAKAALAQPERRGLNRRGAFALQAATSTASRRCTTGSARGSRTSRSSRRSSATRCRGDAPLQLFGGLHYLVLAGRASWDDVGAAVGEREDFLRE